MKIVFDDGSYLELIVNGDKIRVVMCGMKSSRELTMSVSELNKAQLKQLVDFLAALGV